MMQLLSKQDNFAKQESMIEAFIKEVDHYCIFLLKFHCELNLIEMMCLLIFITVSISDKLSVLGVV